MDGRGDKLEIETALGHFYSTEGEIIRAWAGVMTVGIEKRKEGKDSAGFENWLDWGGDKRTK